MDRKVPPFQQRLWHHTAPMAHNPWIDDGRDTQQIDKVGSPVNSSVGLPDGSVVGSPDVNFDALVLQTLDNSMTIDKSMDKSMDNLVTTMDIGDITFQLDELTIQESRYSINYILFIIGIVLCCVLPLEMVVSLIVYCTSLFISTVCIQFVIGRRKPIYTSKQQVLRQHLTFH